MPANHGSKPVDLKQRIVDVAREWGDFVAGERLSSDETDLDRILAYLFARRAKLTPGMKTEFFRLLALLASQMSFRVRENLEAGTPRR